MNTNLIASFLLSTMTTALCAQDIKLEAANTARGMTATVHAAPEGALVLLVLGMNEAAIRLPGGQVLGVEPVMLIGPAIATRAPTNFWMSLRGVEGLSFFVQAAALPQSPKSDADSVLLSQVEKLAGGRGPVELPRDYAQR